MNQVISLSDKKVMVLDTEYDTNPKRLLALAFIVYSVDDESEKKDKFIKYIKYPENVFKVDENGDSFQYHKLTNNYLQENGEDVKNVIEDFYNKLDDVDILIGQNVVSADIQAIRKEAIGLDLWYGKIRDKLKKIPIYDTMCSFRDRNPDVKYSLDSIYQFLFSKDMKNHHDALADCKNTFKCFKKMLELEYSFSNQKFKFSEDIFDELTKESKKCDICESKIPEGNNIYKFTNKFNILLADNKTFTINNNILKENQEICRKCLGNLELVIYNEESVMINLVKLKNYDLYIKDFFKVIGEEPITVYLKSQYKDKDEIKKLGGRWDGRKRSWYFTYTVSTESKVQKFSKWIPISD